MAIVLFVVVVLARAGAMGPGNPRPASSEPPEPFNVGSVLFFAPDSNRHCWHTQDLALLRCRRIMQCILPSRNAVDANEEGNIERLMQYFNLAFDAAVKNAKTQTNGGVTLQAMADAIGGYIKSWALPVAKIGFYGGTITFETANKLSEYYENIKSCLVTDGYYWTPPDEESLRQMDLKITPKKTDVKGYRNSRACKELVFYEEPPLQFAIPIPHVNWEYRPHMMMVPLKKRSLVALEAPSSAYVLYDYHATAQSCLAQRRSIEQKTDFETRFRRWLMTDVLPHLRDDSLYAAFGSVLRLLNGTEGFSSFYKNDLSQNKRFTASAWKRVIPALSQDESVLVKDRIALIVKDSPIFLAALLILWCGPCFLFWYFKHLKCTRRSYSYHLDEYYPGEDDDETTAILQSRRHNRHSRNSNRRSARKIEHSYPCEVVYSGRKNESSFADSSKTSSETKSKTAELLLKDSRAINVNSVNFEKEPPSYSQSRSSMKTSMRKQRSSLKVQKNRNQDNRIQQFDLDLKDVRADEFNDIINYFSNAYTDSQNLVSGNFIDIPTSVSTLVQLDDASSERRLSITDNSYGALISITEVELASGSNVMGHRNFKGVEGATAVNLLHKAALTSKQERPFPEEKHGRAETQSMAPGNARGSQSSRHERSGPEVPTPLQEVSSARREQERPTRIPQKPMSTVRPRGSLKTQEPTL